MNRVKKIGIVIVKSDNKASKRGEVIEHTGPVEFPRFLSLITRRLVTSESNTGSK